METLKIKTSKIKPLLVNYLKTESLKIKTSIWKLRNTLNDYILKMDNFLYFEKVRLRDFEVKTFLTSKFKKPSNFDFFLSKTFVTQKLGFEY